MVEVTHKSSESNKSDYCLGLRGVFRCTNFDERSCIVFIAIQFISAC